MRVVLVTAWGLLLGLVGCTADRTYDCRVDPSSCVRSEVPGTCLLPGYCAFGDSSCDSGLRWDSTAGDGLGGVCVDADDPPPDQRNECGGRALLPGQVGGDCGRCDTGTYECESEEALVCVGEASQEERAVELETSATSILDDNVVDYGSQKATDMDHMTSWFSDGPEAEGATIFTWKGVEERCIGRLEIIGNAMHPDFSTGSGFGQVVVSVRNRFDEVVYTEEHALPGTPDPDLDLDIGERGIEIEMAFTGHENPERGGFAELYVWAIRGD